MSDSREVELELTLINENANGSAFLFSDGDIEAWVPRSLVSSMEEGDSDEEFMVTMPEWLAIEKGFV